MFLAGAAPAFSQPAFHALNPPAIINALVAPRGPLAGALLGAEAGRHRRRVSGKRFPPNRSQNASASADLAKQDTTNSPPSRRVKYVSCAADRVVANYAPSPFARNVNVGFPTSVVTGLRYGSAETAGSKQWRRI
jgi:hypothetical protein